MVKILSSAWGALAGLYRLPGQESAPPGLELGLPVQPVHDLSRQAEFVRQVVVEVSLTQLATAGTVDTTAQTWAGLYTNAQLIKGLAQLGLTRDATSLWYLGVQGFLDDASSVANLDLWTAYLIQQNTLLNGTQYRLSAIANTAIPAATAAHDLPLAYDASGADTFPTSIYSLEQFSRPQLISPEPGSGFIFRLDAGAGGNVTVNFILQLLLTPKGVRPIGLA